MELLHDIARVPGFELFSDVRVSIVDAPTETDNDRKHPERNLVKDKCMLEAEVLLAR
jgi:hypothetical protein